MHPRPRFQTGARHRVQWSAHARMHAANVNACKVAKDSGDAMHAMPKYANLIKITNIKIETSEPQNFIHNQTNTNPPRTRQMKPKTKPKRRRGRKSPATQYARARTWLRDLTEEGIEPHPGPYAKRVCNKNVDGISDAADFEKAMYDISRQNQTKPILAVLIQEHHITRAKARDMNVKAVARRHGLLYVQAAMPDNTTKGGTAVIIPHTSIEKKQGESIDAAANRIDQGAHCRPDGRMTKITMAVEGTEVSIISIYAPPHPHNNQREAFLKEISNQIDKKTIIGIDANCVLDTARDLNRIGTTPWDNKGGKELGDIIASNDLTDVVREHMADTPVYTNHTVVAAASGTTPAQVTHTRIDLILTPQIDSIIWKYNHASRDFLKKAHTTYGHDMIQAEMHVVRAEKGKDLETINEAIYECAEFNTKLATAIQKKIDEINPHAGQWGATWEKIKDMTRELSLEETKKLKATRTDELKAIIIELNILEAQRKAGLADASDIARIQELTKLEKEKKRTNYTLHQTLEREAYERGQKHDVNTAAFHRQMTPRNAAQWVEELIMRDWTDPSNPTVPPDGQPSSEKDHRKIATAFTEYYKPLFARKNPIPAAKGKALDALRRGKKVLPPTAQKCGAPITAAEILHSCAYRPTRKSPGPDRIPNQFYRTFAKIVAPILEKVYDESHKKGHMPKSMTAGIISVLYKKKERDDPRNYRPITLLNGDYKIMASILTKRMNEAVLQFVSPDQNGFVPHAFICENIIRLQLLQTLVEEEDSDALFVFADMEKAFDRCSWEFLIDGLRELEFGEDFIKFVQLTYSHAHPPTRQMHVNGFLGPEFELESGVAQGCPLSPLLFLIIAEPLTRLINDNPKITGIVANSKSGPKHHKVSQFADDSTFTIRLPDIDYLLADINTWCHATGMKENDSKREVLPIGRLKRESHRVPPSILNGTTPVAAGTDIRALGAPIGNDVNEEEWWLM